MGSLVSEFVGLLDRVVVGNSMGTTVGLLLIVGCSLGGCDKDILGLVVGLFVG